nr:immunoglobulin light chain junction region [Macaca mulatta]MOX99272.1 immunoglobulin light chain junction region [Macaca mulatta]MOX99638.1 immunoglobulin light chain junction region [Macaca mulatta]MOX99670.1 immunoglobulin light chain junction region [Macaca mulatta]MOX99864.1 immunoglobulin light chain junction region [Macaca mulatta]
CQQYSNWPQLTF